MIRFFIIFGYFILTLYLHLSGKLNQYINPHYSYLAYITMFLSLLLAIVQAYLCFKRLKEHSHLHSFSLFQQLLLTRKQYRPKDIIFRCQKELTRQSRQVKERAVSISSRIPVAFIHKQLMKILFGRVLINT